MPVALALNNFKYTGTVTLADAAATLTAPAGLTVVSGVDGYEVVREGVTYKLVEKKVELFEIDRTNVRMGSDLSLCLHSSRAN